LLLGIARHLLLRQIRTRSTDARIPGHRLLDTADIQRLEERIGADSRAQRLLGDLEILTAREREVIELVNRTGLGPGWWSV
jgi:RNA polymerase sigma-70 factor (ECF subfamily)